MSNLTERANYLKGLADGLQLNTEKSSTRLLLEVIDSLYPEKPADGRS